MRIFTAIFLSAFFVSATAAAWKRVETGSFAWLHAVQFVDEKYGWAAGSNGTLLSTTGGGQDWKRVSVGTDDNIRDVHFTDRRNGWLLCDRSPYRKGQGGTSYLLKTTDGGESWAPVEIAAGTARMARILFLDDGEGLLIGEAGSTVSVPGSTVRQLSRTLPDRHLMSAGAVTSGALVVLVGGGGSIFRSEDGGNVWRIPRSAGTTPQVKLNGVYFRDRARGWAVGNEGTILSSSDGGRSWKVEISGTSEPLLDVKFYDDRRGYIVGENGTILSTVDSGRSWAADPGVTKHRLERLAFAGNRLFAVGFGGIMLMNEVRP